MFLSRRLIITKQPIKQALNKVKGLGLMRKKRIITKLGVKSSVLLKTVGFTKQLGLTRFVERNYITDNRLDYARKKILIPYISNGSYKGIRYQQGLPANGQRTHSNAATSRKFRIRLRTKKKPTIAQKFASMKARNKI